MRRKASTPSKISLKKGKRVTSWEANKQTKSTSAKRARQTPQGMAKGKARSIFLCEVEEEGFKEAKESTKREKMERESNQHP